MTFTTTTWEETSTSESPSQSPPFRVDGKKQREPQLWSWRSETSQTVSVDGGRGAYRVNLFCCWGLVDPAFLEKEMDIFDILEYKKKKQKTIVFYRYWFLPSILNHISVILRQGKILT